MDAYVEIYYCVLNFNVKFSAGSINILALYQVVLKYTARHLWSVETENWTEY